MSRLAALFVLCASFALQANAQAESPREDALRRLRRANITLVDEERFPDALIVDLASGLARLPPSLHSVPFEIELHTTLSDFGLGDGTDTRPDWTEAGKRFHLYGYKEPPEPRALQRLERLPDKRRESLWRQRAMVHAIIARADALHGFSSRAEWRRIVGWLSPFERAFTFTTRPLIDYPWVFSRRRGLASPALDLATFAEEALVPAEAFDEAAVAPDDRVRCQEFAKSRALASFLNDRATTERLRPLDCEAFEKWARVDSFSHLEVLFSEPSGGKPQSLFGHVALRLVYRDLTVQGPSTQRIVELAALTGPLEGSLEYLFRGLTGGFKAVFQTTSLGALLKQNLETEERSIGRFRVELTAEENRRVLERVWELERKGYVDYYFFSENCAQLVVFLLNGVLAPERHVESPGRFVAFPASSLDVLSDVVVTDSRTGEARPLLTPLTPAFRSVLEEAKAGEIERTEALAQMRPMLPGVLQKRWAAVHDALESNSASRRQKAIDSFDALVDETLLHEAATLPFLALYTGATARLERLALERIQKQAKTADIKRLLLPPEIHLPSTEEMLFARQLSFERERPEERERVRIEEALSLERLLRTAPRRPPTADEEEILASLEHQRTLYAASLERHGRLLDLTGSVPARESPLAAADGTSGRKLPATMSSVVRRSGDGRTSLGLSVARTESGQVTGALTWRSALLADALGESRGHGVGALSELRLLDVQTSWGLGLHWPEHLRTDLTLVGFRTLLRSPKPLRQNAFGSFGWGWELGARLRSLQNARFRGFIALELIVPLRLSPSGESHTLLSIGVRPELRGHWLPDAVAAGPRVRLDHRVHLGGPFSNMVSFRLNYEPRWTLWQSEARGLLWQSVEAEASVTWLFFERLVLGLQVQSALDESPETQHLFTQAGIVAEW